MVTLFWRKARTRALLDGSLVRCPLRGSDVDIEECLTCGNLVRLPDDDRPYLVCDGFADPRLLELAL